MAQRIIKAIFYRPGPPGPPGNLPGLYYTAEEIDEFLGDYALTTALDALLPKADVLNEPDMATGATDKPPSQASVVAYVDNEITDRNLLSAINEADFASNSASHVPTQQSTGLYVRDTAAALQAGITNAARGLDAPVYAPSLLIRPEVQRTRTGSAGVTLDDDITEIAGEYGRAWNLTSGGASDGVNNVPVSSVMGNGEGTIIGKFRVNDPAMTIWAPMGWNYNADGIWMYHRPATPNFSVRTGSGSHTNTTDADWSDWVTIAIAYSGGSAVYAVNGVITARTTYASLGSLPATTKIFFSPSVAANVDMEFYAAYDRRLPDEVLTDLTSRSEALTWASAHVRDASGMTYAASGSTLVSAVTIAYDDASASRIFAGQPITHDQSGTLYWSNDVNHGATWTPFTREFMVDAASVAFSLQVMTTNQSELDVRVNGVSITGGPQVLSVSATSTEHWWRIDLPERDIWRIELVGRWVRFGRMAIGPTDGIWTPNDDLGPRVVVLGDSFTAGVGADRAINGWVYAMAERMGWRDVWNAGIGGTGYANPGNPATGARKFADRVADDIADTAADIVVVQGSTNDASYPGATIQAEAEATLTAIRTALPDAIVVVLLPFELTSSPVAGNVTARDRVLAAATGVADLIIDPMQDDWFSGTGYVGGETGSGNADRYRGTDAAHPSTAGHTYIGYRVAAEIKASGILG